MATLPILPAEPNGPGKKLVGIARLAAEGDSIREGHGVEYVTLNVRSILNRCTAPHMPFAWTINPYRGCEFACRYCYARYTHEFMELRDPYAFEQQIYVKQHTTQLLRQELKRVKANEDIAIGTATDPYQPAEKRYEVTRAVLEEIARHRGLSLGIVTKSQLILRDLDLLREISQQNSLSVCITVTTTDIQLARLLEPRAPRPDIRLDALRMLTAAGITAGVNCAPVLPGITDSRRMLEPVIRAAAEANAHFVFVNPLFLKSCSAAVFYPFLEQHFPHLVASYKKRYEGTGYLPATYRKQLGALVNALCKKHGLPDREERARLRELGRKIADARNQQLALF